MRTARYEIVLLALVASVVACGGSGVPPEHPHRIPAITSTPLSGTILSGNFTITLTATGDGVDLRSLAVTEPSQYAGATATLDAETDSATLSVSGDAAQLSGTELVVTARAVDVHGKQNVVAFRFYLATEPRTMTIDGAFASYRDESSGSATKVAVNDGSTVRKIVTRMGWSGGTPTAADLEGTNAANLPVLKVVDPLDPAHADILAARATLTVGSAAPVTVDLVRATTSPAGQQAFLLPLASNLFPALTALAAPTDVKVTTYTLDDLGHVGAGGPWTITMAPLGPPLVAAADDAYATANDLRSVWPYPRAGDAYANLWGSGFALDGGVRFSRYRITNTEAAPVSVGVTLGGANRWTLSEQWLGNEVSARAWSSFIFSCGGYGCTGSMGPCGEPSYVEYKLVDSSHWQCGPSSYGVPAPRDHAAYGVCTVTAYVGGTNTHAARSDERFVVPAGASLDVYVVRPLATRTGWSPLVHDGTQYEFPQPGSSMYGARKLDEYVQSGVSPGGTYRWSEYMYNWYLATASERIEGTIAFDFRAYDGATEYGPAFTPAAVTFDRTVSH